MNAQELNALQSMIEAQSARRDRLLVELKQLERELHEDMRAYRDGGATQVEVMAASGYRSLDAVRKILDPAVKTKAAAARAARRVSAR